MAPKKSTPTSLAPSLRGGTAIDRELIDQAVADINQIHAGKTLETAKETGEYLLREFFNSDQKAFEAHGKEHTSFRALAEREDLAPSASFLWYAVKLLPQLERLPEHISRALPMSHHRLLLHVHDEKTKARLAKKAVDQGLSKRQLEEEVRKLTKHEEGEGKKRGRKPDPSFVRAFKPYKKAQGTLDLAHFNDAEILTFGIDAADEFLREVEEGLNQLLEVRDQLAERVAALRQEAGRQVVDVIPEDSAITDGPVEPEEVSAELEEDEGAEE